MSIQPATTTNPAPLTAIAARAVRLMSGSHMLGWADQAVVSATNFLLVVMIGRWTDPQQLGAYAIGVSVLALLIAGQDSLISQPYSIQLHRPLGTPGEYAFSAFSLSVLFSMAAAFTVGAAALVCTAFEADQGLIDICWALAGAIPFVLMREFARRFSFAHLVFIRAFLLDCAVAMMVMLSLALIAWFGELSAASALAVTGVVCGIGSIGSLYLMRQDFSWNVQQLKPTFWRNWQTGKWLLSGQIAAQAQGYVTPWLALIIAGTAVTGIYAACASVVALTNPFVYGFLNVLLPKFARTLQQQGVTALQRQACRDAILLAGTMGAFALVVFAFGDDIMRLLYRNESYGGYGHTLVVFAVAALAGVVGTPASIALTAAERTRCVACVKALTAMLSLALIAALLPNWGLLGAAYGLLAAETVGSIGRWVAFLLLVPNVASVDQKQ